MTKELLAVISSSQPTPNELSKTPITVRNYIKLLEKAIISFIKKSTDNDEKNY